MFILGLPTKNQDTVQASISKEAVQFGDIVQGNFIDTYRNLSTKNIYGNLWVSLFCNNTEIVVKTDDDTFVDLYAVYFLTRKVCSFYFYIPKIQLHSSSVYVGSKKNVKLKTNIYYR